MPTVKMQIGDIISEEKPKKDGGTFTVYRMKWKGTTLDVPRDRKAALEALKGKWQFVTYEGQYNKVTNIAPVPPEDVPSAEEVKAEPTPLSNNEIGQKEGNCNNATAAVFGQVVRFGYFLKEEEIIPAWKRYLNANRVMNGLPPVEP